MTAVVLHSCPLTCRGFWLQVIIKVSQLLGESVVLDSSHFYESLALISSYANSDKAMTRTSE